MEEIEIPLVYAPEVYPVQGRIFDEDDPDYKEGLIEFLSHKNKKPYIKVNYQGHSLVFQ